MIWMEILGGFGSALAIAGVILNNRKIIACFPLWMASNTICLVVHALAAWFGESPWSMLVRDTVFLVLAFDGYYRWGKDKAQRDKGVKTGTKAKG